MKAKPLVFLDFDGVLNSTSSALADMRLPRGRLPHNPIAVGLMARLVVQAGAQVVVSSAWRIGNSLDELRGHLCRWGGEEIASRLLDKTPQWGESRGAEIAAWLASNPNDHDGNYVIVDDDGDMLDGQLSRFVQTRHRDGFGMVDYLKALGIIAPQHEDCVQFAWYAENRPLSSEARNPDRKKLEWESA